jgi:hypothetical protein
MEAYNKMNPRFGRPFLEGDLRVYWTTLTGEVQYVYVKDTVEAMILVECEKIKQMQETGQLILQCFGLQSYLKRPDEHGNEVYQWVELQHPAGSLEAVSAKFKNEFLEKVSELRPTGRNFICTSCQIERDEIQLAYHAAHYKICAICASKI